jgi:hypothetical protein
MSKAEEAPSLEQWEEWLQHPCTKALREWAREKLAGLKDEWASGTFTASFDIEMMAKNAGATGACSVYAEVEEMDFGLIAAGGLGEESKRT